MDSKIQGLLIEREGYARRNLKDRIAAVDAELAALGYRKTKAEPQVETADAPRAPETASAKPRAARKQD